MRNIPTEDSPTSCHSFERFRIVICGAVQGVGFRPFIYRMAQEQGLSGWVFNNRQGVIIEVEGMKERLEQFAENIIQQKPPQAMIYSLETSILDPVGYKRFDIRESELSNQKDLFVMPDMAMCQDCRKDIADPKNRRYRYPFTNCTNCGPRYSIIEDVPYDRFRTTMRDFTMCSECYEEYSNPENRRFHAQPNACGLCGPRLALWDSSGQVLDTQDEALLHAASLIKAGQIVAVKGLGGFHLFADARDEFAARKLRDRKRREEKPFAVMFPSLSKVKEVCHVCVVEERLLTSSQAPIVLLHRKILEPFHDADPMITSSVAPHSPTIGALLPYTPLHDLLMNEMGFPVVATSANISDEPICIDEVESLERLKGIADFFLVHNRPIARHVDDSIVRVMMNREFVLRRARGYAPLPIRLAQDASSTLALGSELKNTIAFAKNHWVYISPHIGDLNHTLAFHAHNKTVDVFGKLFKMNPVRYVRDSNPDFVGSHLAELNPAIPVISIQHHYAHILSCMAENDITNPAFGVAWDGTGFGPDRTVWGGEFLRIEENSFLRVAHLRRFRLPGSDKAVLEPRRVALSLLYDIFGDQVFEMHDIKFIQVFQKHELTLIKSMLQKGIHAPMTSSMGRLFDGVCALLGLVMVNAFEAQAAMALEHIMAGVTTDAVYPYKVIDNQLQVSVQSNRPHIVGQYVIDWEPLIKAILDDLDLQISAPMISAKFHNTLVDIIIAMSECAGLEKVVLSGGCFQNRYLLENAVIKLLKRGFRPFWHQRVPTNDGGLALGQILGAVRLSSKEKK